VNNSNCIRIESGAISIPKVGKINIVQYGKLASTIRIVTVQLSYGKWNVSLTQEVECKAAKPLLSSIVGYDINSQHTIVGSNGWYVKKTKSF
jgi:putative transposase